MKPVDKIGADPLRRLVNAIAFFVALATAVALPTSYFSSGSNSITDYLKFRARFDASAVARYIYTHEQMWQYQAIRLAEVLEAHKVKGEELRVRIVDGTGATVVDSEDRIDSPTTSYTAPIIVAGRTVGYIHADASMRPLVEGTALALLLGIFLGLGVYFAVRLFPLRVIDRTVGELRTTNLRFDTALANMPQGLSMFDREQRLLVHNRRYAELYGLDPALIKPGISLSEILKLRAASGTYYDNAYDTGGSIKPGLPIEPWNGEVELSDGRIVNIVRTPMSDGGWVSTHEDVTQRKHAQERIEFLAHHDVLTGLPNRAQFHHDLEQVLRMLPRDLSVAVMCLDLDDFKSVNDTLGHPIGDKLLQAVALRLKDCLRDTDMLARLGGDEFAVIATATATPLADASTLAGRLIEEVSRSFRVDEHEIVVGLSVGIAFAPNDSSNHDQLLKSADMALYRAKSAGRGTYRFFEPEMDAQAQARRLLELDLRAALTKGEMVLHYQPIVSMATQEIVAMEALVRWNHPLRGLIPPLDFIPLAEETGLIVPLGEWVLRQACADAATWSMPVRVAVNLSPAQFKSPRLVHAVVSAVTAAALAADRLELEITESVLLNDNAATLAKLHSLRDFGAHISMDDFGTGYSSLSYLRSFPFDKIKIDRSFVQELGSEDQSLAIIRAVTGLGGSLGMATTAEGVETEEQIALLRQEGCTEMQGYAFSPPRPAAEVEGLLHTFNGARAVA
jgi:diguanylate cyclase (GGDEF)-like protein